MWRLFLSLTIFLFMPGLARGECVPGSTSTTFNASRDLHKVQSLGYHNLKPNQAKLDATPRLNAAISYVIHNTDCHKLTVDSGTYYFRSLAPGGNAYLVLQDPTKDFDFQNASFIFQESYFPAFYVTGCKQCSVSNVSIDYVHLPFTQLTVKHVSQNQSAIVAFPQSSAWPTPQQLYNHQSRFGQVFLWGFDTRDGVPQYGYTRWSITPPLRYAHRIPLSPYGVIHEQDIFIVAARGGGPAIRVEHSQSGTLKDITIYTSAGPGLEMWYSQGMSLIGMNIVPGSNRLVSTVAGGIELDAISGPGNIVRSSVVQGAQDDSIAGNVAASYGVISGGTTDTVTLCPQQTMPSSPTFLVNSETGYMAGDPLTGAGYSLASNGSGVYPVTPSFSPEQVKNLPSSVIYNAGQFNTANYVTVESNQISNSYLARGIAFSGVGGIRISDNTITNTQQAGIYLGTSLPENGPVNDALVAGNQLRSTNMGMSGVGTGMLGAIEIMSFAMVGQAISEQPSQKIFISGNTISKTKRTGIWIANVRSGDVEQNTIEGTGQAQENLGIEPHLNFGIEPYAKQAFQQEAFGWCNKNVSGTTLSMCNLQLQAPLDPCPPENLEKK
jgi:parallel beta-helix repeat protein